MRRAARRDENEPPIVSALRAAGATVALLNGKDIPDLLVGFRGRNFALEVKMPLGPKGGASDHQNLKPGQQLWHNAWNGQCCVVRSIDEALDAIGVEPADSLAASFARQS